MSINVNSTNAKNNVIIEQNKVQKHKDTEQSNSTKVTSSLSDSVQLTEQAQSLNKMKTENASEPQVNMKRVESIKSAILNGEYKINSEQLAEKLGSFESDFSKASTS